MCHTTRLFTLVPAEVLTVRGRWIQATKARVMRARWSRIELILAMTVVIAAVAPVRGQQCDDGNACTTSDMCVSEECGGTPATTGSCDDGNDCTVNDRCVPVSPTEPDGCMGDPAPVGTDCQGGCGTCESVSPKPIPGLPVFCTAKPDIADQLCESSSSDPCADDRCRVLPGNFVACRHRMKVCPDTDGNPCTDACDLETGECAVNAPRCIPVCQLCDPGTGRCEPANLGAACDDFDVCTAQSRCELIEGFSVCMPGVPTVFTPTPTLPVVSTAPPTASPTQGACVGDCDNDLQVRVNELVLGTNIALDLAELSECPEFDEDNDGNAEVNELVLGVTAALNGCVGAAVVPQ